MLRLDGTQEIRAKAVPEALLTPRPPTARTTHLTWDVFSEASPGSDHFGHAPGTPTCSLLQDPGEWILGEPIRAIWTVNKKDFACTEDHTHLQQSASTGWSALPWPCGAQLGMVVLG